jgi:hypothetical protein
MALRGVASQGNTSASTTVTVTVSGIGGTGPQAGDIVLLMVGGGGGTTATFTYPSGFAPISGLANQAVSGVGTQGIAYKVAGGSEPSSYTVTSSINDFQTVHCRVYSGRNTVAPFTATQASSTTFSGTSPETYAFTALTAAAGDDIVLQMGNQYYDGTNAPGYAPPAGYGNGNSVFGAAQFSPVITASDKLNASAGSSGTNGGVITVAGATNLGYGTFALALAAGAAAPAQVPYMPYAFQPTMAQ